MAVFRKTDRAPGDVVALDDRWLRSQIRSPRHPVEDVAGAFEFREALLFFAKFAGMGNHGATGAASGMLDVQHLVEQNVFYSARRNAGTIHAAIQKNLIWAGIVTAKLPPPASRAPANVRAL